MERVRARFRAPGGPVIVSATLLVLSVERAGLDDRMTNAGAHTCLDCGGSLEENGRGAGHGDDAVQGEPRGARTFRCTRCRHEFALRDGNLVREVSAPSARRARRPTPKLPQRKRPPTPRMPRARESSHGAGLGCPDCRTELVLPLLSTLQCPGCGARFWMRGAQLVREGSLDALEAPGTTLPQATARVRRRKDES